jgi:hypothetical protein
MSTSACGASVEAVLTSLPLAAGSWAAGLTVAGVLALVLVISALTSIFRNPELSGGAKTMWLVIVILVPILGPLVYFGVRSDW